MAVALISATGQPTSGTARPITESMRRTSASGKPMTATPERTPVSGVSATDPLREAGPDAGQPGRTRPVS